MKRLYPRPQLKRNNWVNLNGEWNFDFDDKNLGIINKWYENHHYTKKIIVPFPYQSKLSGIHDVSMHERVWYNTTFEYQKPKENRLILHFGAVDYETNVYINKRLV